MNQSDKTLIEISSVTKKYQDKAVLKDISTKIIKGRFYALLGHNGAGKSTLLNIISGQEFASTGSGTIFDCNIENDLAEEKSLIGLVSENISFNFQVPLNDFFKAYSSQFSRWNQAKFIELVNKQNIDLSKEFSEFSRGQKMQIVLIATIATGPEILLIDEITSVLDVYSRLYFIELLKEFTTKGGTVVMTTNIIHEVQNYCTDAIILKHGELLLDSPIDAIPSVLAKVRKTKENKEHKVFEHPQLFFVSVNGDMSKSYLIRHEYVKDMEINSLIDRREITLQELFLFYTGEELQTDNYKDKAA